MSKQKITEYFNNAFKFLFQSCTYEFGNVQQIWRMSIEVRYNDFYGWLVDELSNQMKAFTLEGSDGSACQFTDLILLLLDSLIFNLYLRHKSNDKNKIHNSLYQASVQSVSQLGIQGSGKYGESGQFTGSVALHPSGPGEVHAFIQSIERLLKDREFFKNLETLMSYNDSDQNKLQLSFFINSLEYMVEKEGITEDALAVYQRNKKFIEDYLVDMQKMAEQEEIEEVNQLLFSKKLFKIRKLLTMRNEGQPREVHFAVLRIYFAAYSKRRSNFKRKHFQSLKYTGESQIYSIMKMYVVSQHKRDNLFRESEQGADALLDFIVNYLLLLFYPVFCSFQQLFEMYVCPHAEKKAFQFFPAIETAINDYFIPFFEQLPTELCNLLAQIHHLVKVSPNFTDTTSAIFPVTTLFINRFLLNPSIKLLQTEDVDDFVQAANLFKDLFYTNVAKQYQQIPSFVSVSQKLRSNFEILITTYDEDRTIDVFSYFVTDPLLRNDYSFLYGYFAQIQFTHSDNKEVEIDTFDPSKLPRRNKVIQVSELLEQQKKNEVPKAQKQKSTKTAIRTAGSQIIDDPAESRHETSQNQRTEPSEMEIIEKLTGLRREEPPQDSFRAPSNQSQPTYEDYNTRQQKQYLQHFQSPQFISNSHQQTPQLSMVNTPANPKENPTLMSESVKPQSNLLSEFITPIVQYSRRDAGSQTTEVLPPPRSDTSPISYHHGGPGVQSRSISQVSQFTQVDIHQPKVVQVQVQRKDSFEIEQQTLKRIEDEIQPYKDQIEQLQKDYKKTVDQHQQQIKQLKHQQEIHNQQKEAQIQQIQMYNCQLEAEIEATRADVTRLNDQLDHSENEKLSLNAHLSDLLDQKEMLLRSLDNVNENKLSDTADLDHQRIEYKINQYKKNGPSNQNEELSALVQHLQQRQATLLKGQVEQNIANRVIERQINAAKRRV